MAIAQVLLDCPNERRFLRLARQRLSHLFPYVPGQSGFNGELVVSDKGFAGAEFEAHVRSLGAELIRPDRKDENPRFGSLGGIRQWIESTFNTLKEQLSLERHGGRTLTGLVSRIARRLLALTAVILHNWQTGNPGRRLTAYDH